MADVFLSYARADAAVAQRIAREFAKCGRSVWFDRELPAHRAYADVIATELEAAPSVMVLWSRASVESEWVRSEANRARELHKLVQARVDDARLPMPFEQIQCADLRGWRGLKTRAAWQQVCASIDALVARPASEPSAQVGQPMLDRRKLLAAGGVVAVAAVAGVGFWQIRSHEQQLSPQAQLLMQKGFDALQDNDALNPGGPGSTMEAIALLTQATQAAPNSALAWGGLALAFAVRKRTVPLPERGGLDMRSRAAAKRALELDPREGRAIGALLLLDPVYRHWLETERADREAVRKDSSIPLLFSITADMLGNVGRWREALSFSKNIDRQHFLIPGAERRFIIDAWAAGDLPTADNALQMAVAHWPQEPEIWRTRIAYLMYSGRAGEALDLLREDAERPSEIPDDFVRATRAVATALAGAQAPNAAVDEQLAFLRNDPGAALNVVNACSALGVLDEMFRILDGYYFGAGKWTAVAPFGGDQDRITSPLFLPPMKPAWADPRFAPLLERIGLEGYWRKSGKQPDFRRVDSSNSSRADLREIA